MNEEDPNEVERRKRAIFDAMSRRGQERILRMGYENWDPFQEPKDPRERIFSGISLRASSLVKEFTAVHGGGDLSVEHTRDLFDFCRALLQGEPRARLLADFCVWIRNRNV
ncbi:MAG: hypothetical protein KBH99_07765 [Syntrophobacteraceae bacterium]|nr:hypothetical protein [Syntrophobacteraceae bacterium]